VNAASVAVWRSDGPVAESHRGGYIRRGKDDKDSMVGK
jgi:hypothetical protein